MCINHRLVQHGDGAHQGQDSRRGVGSHQQSRRRGTGWPAAYQDALLRPGGILSLGASGTLVLVFFILGIIGVNFFNPQYTIPIAGMIFGNSMTGVTLGLKSFKDNLTGQKDRIEALINIGAKPKKVLRPFANSALETALLPTMNSMLGMGIIALPGMMTGQILSGTLPMTAILYQIAIVICICAVVCIASFFTLNFGYRTLYNR